MNEHQSAPIPEVKSDEQDGGDDSSDRSPDAAPLRDGAHGVADYLSALAGNEEAYDRLVKRLKKR